ncbi:hypothetical protein ONZ51_g8680 [Trametes cubensis]|uniref:Uncharacterized protein n=1 Tax=Trametes cubensis TaxID=1111947 RepID=A0AAD7TQ91_9APHY|nr:hypothetical protein ONZ51_g8680 [Trametes cubensis]
MFTLRSRIGHTTVRSSPPHTDAPYCSPIKMSPRVQLRLAIAPAPRPPAPERIVDDNAYAQHEPIAPLPNMPSFLICTIHPRPHPRPARLARANTNTKQSAVCANNKARCVPFSSIQLPAHAARSSIIINIISLFLLHPPIANSHESRSHRMYADGNGMGHQL